MLVPVKRYFCLFHSCREETERGNWHPAGTIVAQLSFVLIRRAFFFFHCKSVGLTLIATSRRCTSSLKSLKVCKKTKQKTSETRPKRKGACLHSPARCNINEISVQSVAKQRRRRVVRSVMGLGNSSAVSITLSTRRPGGRVGGGGSWELFCVKWWRMSIMREENGCTVKQRGIATGHKLCWDVWITPWGHNLLVCVAISLVGGNHVRESLGAAP